MLLKLFSLFLPTVLCIHLAAVAHIDADDIEFLEHDSSMQLDIRYNHNERLLEKSRFLH